MRTDGERNATFSHFLRDLVQTVCALHKHEGFALSLHVSRAYPSRNLDVARRVYNYRLTRARRMVEFAFGIVCKKWRIFHCAIDICPDFCDVIVTTCCILHNVLHTAQRVAYCTTCCILHNLLHTTQRVAYYTTSFVTETAFCFRILNTNVPFRVLTLRLLMSYIYICIYTYIYIWSTYS